ncbi:MAG: protein kinase domain-containing protein [Candidatus Sulfotelmatobacter sp.]
MGQTRQPVESVFADALELAPRERQAFLDHACGGDLTLRRLVEELLREDERAGSFLRLPIVGERQAAATASSASDHLMEAPVAQRFAVGEIIAQRFLVVRFIARGGMGEVYEVEDRLLQGDRVALKIIRPEIAAHEESSHRFEQEVLLARKINHPNLCPIYEIFRCEEPPPFLFLTMKLLTGETLDACLRKNLLLPREEALAVFRQMISGISAIHNAGVIHRDIKPTNVMLDRSGLRLSVSIMDFGLAHLNKSEANPNEPGTFAGTPGYVAPELMHGHRPSRASDIFALGVLLHQIFTGERPIESAGELSVRAAPSLETVPVAAVYKDSVREFLSDNPVIRCRAFERFRSSLEDSSLRVEIPEPPRALTRRQMLVASGGAFCAIAGGALWKRDTIADYMHPIPVKRFVALLGWPPSADAKIKPVLTGLMNSISSELARAEAYDRNLFLIPQQTSDDVKTTAQLNEVRESLGANLVLAASGMQSSKGLQIGLKVLDPSMRTLRSKDIRVPLDRQLSLPQKAVHAAAELLNLTRYQPDDKRTAVGTDNPKAYAAFQVAEALRERENDSGLEPAIEKYKEATDLDPHYSLAQAKLALAYCRLWALEHNPGTLVLSRAAADAALALNQDLTEAHNARGFVMQEIGDRQSAQREMKKALALDPGNTQTLIWQAQVYTNLNQWQAAEAGFRRALQLRPNHWLAHNELGNLLEMQGRYTEALLEFRAANVVNPRNALALLNMGCMYLLLGRAEEASDRLRQSMKLRPDPTASATMAQVLCSQGKPELALQYAKEATKLDPHDSTTWLELGDCYSTLRDHRTEARRAYAAGAQTQQENLQMNPLHGPGWILLALLEAKAGSATEARLHIRKGDALPTADIDSQLYKARTFEQLGMRKDALDTLEACFKRGATRFQIDLMPEMASLKKDPLYQKMVPSTGS